MVEILGEQQLCEDPALTAAPIISIFGAQYVLLHVKDDYIHGLELLIHLYGAY